MFLVGVPRKREGVSSSSRQTAAATAILESTYASYSQLLGEMPGYRHEILYPEGVGGTSVLMLEKSIDESNAKRERGFWSVAAGSPVARDIVNQVSRHAGRLGYDKPVWGSYAAVYGERYAGKVTAWNTTPSIEAIHYGQSAEITFISNRPLLVALALNAGAVNSVQLSRAYLSEYLLYGYSMTSQSPFEGVKVLTSGLALSVSNGEIELEDFPQGLVSSLKKFHSTEEGAEALSASLRNASRRVLQHLDGREVQVRASGGKDSRVLFGLLRGEEARAYAVTFGQQSDEEVAVARFISEKSGIPLEATSPPEIEGKTLREQVQNILKLCDGMPLSEPHASIYSGANVRTFGDGIMLGQWPLMKGGAATKMSYREEEVANKIRNQGADILRPEERFRFDQFFDQWSQKRSASSTIEKLYLFSRDFRASRWMLALTCMYDRDATVAYPLADSEVAAVSDALTMAEKVAQTAYFLALNSIWPEALSVPLVGSIWRFEARGPVEGYGSEKYADRMRTVKQFMSDVDLNGARSTSPQKATEFLGSTARELASGIVTSPNAQLFKSILREDFWSVIENWAVGKQPLFEQYSRRWVIQLLWRVYVADVWYQCKWLTAG